MKGPISHLLLPAIAVLEPDAYGVRIMKAIGESMSCGQMYIYLDTLEAIGVLRSECRDATPQRGGRPKRYFYLTDKGRRELQEIK